MYTFWGSETVFHKIIGENLKKFEISSPILFIDEVTNNKKFHKKIKLHSIKKFNIICPKN